LIIEGGAVTLQFVQEGERLLREGEELFSILSKRKLNNLSKRKVNKRKVNNGLKRKVNNGLKLNEAATY